MQKMFRSNLVVVPYSGSFQKAFDYIGAIRLLVFAFLFMFHLIYKLIQPVTFDIVSCAIATLFICILCNFSDCTLIF